MTATHSSDRQDSARFRPYEWMVLGFFLIAVVFGGGSRGAGDTVVHLAAAILFPFAVVQNDWRRIWRQQKLWLLLLAGMLLLPALQMLPLGAASFERLNGMQQVAGDLRVVGPLPDRLAMTLDHWGTVRGLLWAFVAVTAWLAANSLSVTSREYLFRWLVAVAVLMALLGFAQSAAGNGDTLRFYEVHNDFGATGTFANRNHFGIFMAMCAVLSLGLMGRALHRHDKQWPAYGLATVVTYLAATLSYSRFAFLLGSAAVLLCTLYVWWDHSVRGSRRWGHLGLAAGLAVAALAVANYAWLYVSARFERDVLEDLRFQYAEYGVKAMQHYLPWGSGIGSFRFVYAPFEPTQAMVSTYALHAHNDFLEVALEAGLPGLILIGLAVLMFVWAALRQWRMPADSLYFALGVAILLPMLHSTVDYPLRTLAVLSFSMLMAVHWSQRKAG